MTRPDDEALAKVREHLSTPYVKGPVQDSETYDIEGLIEEKGLSIHSTL